jgi:hypothetical protein
VWIACKVRYHVDVVIVLLLLPLSILSTCLGSCEMK